MFVCTKCRPKVCKEPAEVHTTSMGTCELCKKRRECFDCPSRHADHLFPATMPMAPRSVDDIVKACLTKKGSLYEEVAAGIRQTTERVARTGVPEMTAIQRCPHGRRRVLPRGPADAGMIAMETAGVTMRTSKREMHRIIRKIYKRLTSRVRPDQVELEGVWSDGSIRRKKGFSCSTGVAIMQLEALTVAPEKLRCKACQDVPGKDGRGQPCKPCGATGYILTGKTHSRVPMLVRVFHDGMLVREWDQRNNRYNLELD